jgi:ABC-type bacteriocin/lantibiotic exporter with double-glycine peptidase domain
LFGICNYSLLQHSCRYEEVIQACTLDVDISAMVGGDMSHIGEKGLNLSGGQRARLALARSFLKNCAVEIGKPEVLLLTL